MIELLVVISIMAILISIVAVASTALIGRARTNSTQALLAVVNQAVEDFKREKPPMTQKSAYLKRYGPYPPDELEVFITGVPGTTTTASLAPGGAKMQPPIPPARAMKFYAEQPEFEHRDLAAMIVGIETLSESAASVLQQIPDRSRVAGPAGPNGPLQYLDRAGSGVGSFDANDHEVRYIVDDWGIPLGYMTQRDFSSATGAANTPGSNHPKWNQTSTELVRLNAGAPVIFSWGADGKDQLTADAMEADAAKASIVGDWVDDNDSSVGKLDHLLNADNVYANPALKEKITEGITRQQ